MSEAVDAKQAPLDVITIGRASVDLYGQQIGSRLEDITSFAKSVGGCPANISVGTARLGLRSALLTRVGDEQMGRFIREQLKREGVNTDGLKTDKERLTALVLLSVESEGVSPMIFYRSDCADMRRRRPGPMPAAPSPCRGCSARRNIRPSRSCSSSSRTAANTGRCARTRRSTISIGQRPGGAISRR